MTLYTTLDRSDRSVEVGLEYLRGVGVSWSPHPTKDEVRREYESLWEQLGSRPIEAITDLPRMTDADLCATLEVLIALHPSAMYTDFNLHSLVVGRMANISLVHGNDASSCSAYVWAGYVIAMEFGNYRAGFRFGRTALDLVDKGGLDRFRARVYLGFAANCNLWGRHARTSLDLIRRAYAPAQETGDVMFVVNVCACTVMTLLVIGDPLTEVEREAENGIEIARKAKFGLVVDALTGQLQLILTLRGVTPVFGSFNDTDFDESSFEQHLEADPRLAIAQGWYWNQKLQARFYAGDYVSAMAAVSKLETLLWAFTAGLPELAGFYFYGALVRAALYDAASADERSQHLDSLRRHYRQLEVWAENCPDNFENRRALVGAEIARIEGRELDAERLYERAIESAHENGFVHNEALANELAARFYAARGFKKIADTYLRDARRGYLRWGADGKVRQLDRLYPGLNPQEPVPGPVTTIGAPIEQLDLATVIKVSQAVSSEIVLEKLIDTIMRTAVEHAGAERGLLIVQQGPDLRIEAEATTSGDSITIRVDKRRLSEADLAMSVLHFVIRTQENVILDDASRHNSFAGDEYIRQRHARSVLCLPLLKQGKLIAVLYLENNLAPNVFTPSRMACLKVLASEAAISLENSRLYRELQEREAKIRRLVDSNIIGVLISDPQGQILEANDAFLEIVGYSREDLTSGRLRSTKLNPAEWQTANDLARTQIRATGSCEIFEKEYVRKDGSRVPVLVGSAAIGDTRSGTEVVAFVLDLTERKKAEREVRRLNQQLEQRIKERTAQLAEANRQLGERNEELARVSRMKSEFLARISHELRTPLNSISGFSDLLAEESEGPLGEIYSDYVLHVKQGANHLTALVNEILDLSRIEAGKIELQYEEFTAADGISEVLSVAGSLAEAKRIDLCNDVPSDLRVFADRTRFKQILYNLVGNALKFTPVGAVRISAEPGDGEVRFLVSDTGIGIPQEEHRAIFDEFHQVGPASTTLRNGAGLGLAITKRLVELHGGRIWVESAPGKGSRFFFTMLPGAAVEGEGSTIHSAI
jgi:PAS domain S-box-containing protein